MLPFKVDSKARRQKAVTVQSLLADSPLAAMLVF